jgi:hypothetical protein
MNINRGDRFTRLVSMSSQAADVVFDPNNSTQATGIENLNIGGTFYNVEFTSTGTVAGQVYGMFPGRFDFTLATTAAAAVDAVNRELNKAGATGVGAEGSVAVPFFWVGFDSEQEVNPQIEVVIIFESLYGELTQGGVKAWVAFTDDPGSELYNFGTGVWAKFTEVSSQCTVDADCDDGLFCNGAENCVDGSCETGTPPCKAGEICKEDTNSCEADPQSCNGDFDGDGDVDGTDLSKFAADFGRTDCPLPQ